jgi:hypothetical protein
MRDYLQEYTTLNKAINDDILNTFLAVEKKIGSEILTMGIDHVTRQPIVLSNKRVIRINLNRSLDGYYTKCNHIGLDNIYNNMFIKGFQLFNKRYRLNPIHELSIVEKSYILNYLLKQFKEILK